MIPVEIWTKVVASSDVTDEILELVRSVESGWYNDSPIDWEDVWDRVDGSRLTDGTCLDWGPETDTPAMRKIQRVIRAERKAG